MKKYILLFFVSVTILGSCKFDEILPTYGTTSVLFWNQNYNRNIVVGEGLKLKVGLILGGLVINDQQRVVKYAIDPSLITDPARSVLPVKYYTLGHATDIVIPEGKFDGYLSVVMDSAAFLADPKSVTGEYVLPVKITGSIDVDSINAKKNYMLVSISYWAKQHGYYNYSGTAVKKSGTTVVSTVTYKDNSTVQNSIRTLTTVGSTKLSLVADLTGTSADPAKNKYSFYVTLPTKGGGDVAISSNPASTFVVTPNGTSTYVEATKTFLLNYKYTDGANTIEVSESMVFRNRIRDVQSDGRGVIEWRGF